MRVLVIGMVSVGVMLSACGRKGSSSSKIDSTSTTDSVVYIETVREVIVKVPGDTVQFRVEIPCKNTDSTKTKPIHYSSRSKRAKIDLTYNDGVITGDCTCDELEQLVLAKDRYIKGMHKYYAARIEESTKVVTKYDRWFWYLLTWFVASILYIAFKIYLKFTKPI